MGQEDITRIIVGQGSVGIIGLKQALEEIAEGFSDKGDEETSQELLECLSKRNYIPSGAREEYSELYSGNSTSIQEGLTKKAHLKEWR